MGSIASAQYYNTPFNWGWGNLGTFNNQYNYNYDYGNDDNLTRNANAYEVQESQGPGYTTYNYRQYTSAYDAMMGNIVPDMTISYSSSNPYAAMFNPFQPQESHSEGSAVGSLYPQSTMSFFQNPFSGMIAQMAPRYEGYSSNSIFGNTNFMMNYPGMGNSGFMWSPFMNMGAGNQGGNYQYPNYMY
jgi:hypothetical protein